MRTKPTNVRTMKSLEDELAALYQELEYVKNYPGDYLPEYGYSPKEEIIALVEEDIAEVEAEMQRPSPDYTPEEFEDERMRLCISQGIPRYAS